MEQVLEMALPIGWITEPFKYACVLMSWVRSKSIPTGNLTLAFTSTALSKFYGFNSGPRPRFQCKIGKPIPSIDVFKGLLIMYNMINECDDLKSRHKLKSEASQLKCYHNCLDNLRQITNYGDLGAQHVIMALLLTRVIDIPQLTKMAIICPKTNTCKRIIKDYGVKSSQLDSLLTAVASLLGVDRVVAENVICEALRENKKWDFFLPCQSFYFYFEENGVSKIVATDVEGKTSDVMIPVFVPEVRERRQCPTWWKGDIAMIPKSMRDYMITPSREVKNSHSN